MTTQINSKYLENYAKAYSEIVCDRFFAERQFISGQDIIGLTNAVQVNFFVIKHLFELWQKELQKLKSNPYFDYRDIAVHEALTQFMNVLSRRIRVEKGHFRPLLEEAVKSAVLLATEPVKFYQSEIEQAPANQINQYLRENKKYYKWHDQLVVFLIDKAGFGQEASDYKKAIEANYHAVKEKLESVNMLLATLGDIKVFDLDHYQKTPMEGNISDNKESENEVSSFFDSLQDEGGSNNLDNTERADLPDQEFFPSPIEQKRVKISEQEIRSRFSADQYSGLKARIDRLPEAITINQRFMFRKELFDESDDLMTYALNTIEECKTLGQALDFINGRLANELNWKIDSEPVEEFLSLIFRRFAD